MKVLTIDVDYITSNYSRFLESDFNFSPNKRWTELFENTPLIPNDLHIDSANLLFSLDVFSKAISRCNNVVFGSDHENILYLLENEKNIELINLDQHHDIAYGINQVTDIEKYGICWESCWVWWLYSRNKLTSYDWICNETSQDYNQTYFKTPKPGFTPQTEDRNLPPLNVPFRSFFKENYEFSNFDFDLIFVSESKQYIAPQHWYCIDLFKILHYNTFKEYPKEINQKFKFDYSKHFS
jgi:hypothetical protein|tara:strand:- start:33 stop:749 length:717 start_codon:yes stop_codon:yes gene_type:complete